MSPAKFEKIAASVSSMKKTQLKKRIKGFKGNFDLDFTDTYLNSCSEEKLRHILLAALITSPESRAS